MNFHLKVVSEWNLQQANAKW